MTSRRSAKVEDPAASYLPLFSNEEYDFTFNTRQWPVGLKSTYPEELVRRVGAAVVSYQAGNSAVDYTYKRYFKDHSYSMDDGSRLDLRVAREIKNKMDVFSEFIFQITSLEPKRNGQFISEWTFLRIPFSVNFLLSCANRGAFFESAAIARMIVEQIAWATAVDEFNDLDQIQGTSATKSIGSLKAKVTGAGRLYGWLSVHAHWAYEGHVKAMHHLEDGRTSTLFATTKFKAFSLALTLLISILSIKVFVLLRKSEAAQLFQSDTAQTLQISDSWEVRDGEVVPSLMALRSLTNLETLSALMVELASHYPDDPDIAGLVEIATSEGTERNKHG